LIIADKLSKDAPLNTLLTPIGCPRFALPSNSITAIPKEAELGKQYALQRYEPSTDAFDNWLILNKTKHEENRGAVRFRSGILTLARKELTAEDKDYTAADTMQIMYKVISEFEAKGTVACTLKTFSSLQQHGPGNWNSGKRRSRAVTDRSNSY
jgi:hypothetical protein